MDTNHKREKTCQENLRWNPCHPGRAQKRPQNRFQPCGRPSIL